MLWLEEFFCMLMLRQRGSQYKEHFQPSRNLLRQGAASGGRLQPSPMDKKYSGTPITCNSLNSFLMRSSSSSTSSACCLRALTYSSSLTFSWAWKSLTRASCERRGGYIMPNTDGREARGWRDEVQLVPPACEGHPSFHLTAP